MQQNHTPNGNQGNNDNSLEEAPNPPNHDRTRDNVRDKEILKNHPQLQIPTLDDNVPPRPLQPKPKGRRRSH